jgi:hypothetical protein
VGIHICACESPTTTIDLELVVFPTRQILLELWELVESGTQPCGSE